MIDNRCGLVDPANPGRCGRQIASSQAAGILSRDHLPQARHARQEVRVWAVFAPRGILGRLLAAWLLVQIGRTGRHLLGDLKHYAEHGVPSPRKQAQLDRAGRDPAEPATA